MTVEAVHEATRSTPGSCASCRQLALRPGARSRACAPTSPSTPARPSSPPRRRTTTPAGSGRPPTRSAAATTPSVMILGSGPNRIGQGIEFDYCCVHAAMTVRESGRDAVMVNCNPETVSTDYDTSDRLYFEPLTLEDVLGIVEVEQPEGVIVQFGGQTPLKLAAGLADAGVPLLGTSVDAIDLAEDRSRFSALLDQIGAKAPPYATASTREEALAAAPGVGFPLLVRPSYVLGGRAMEVVYSTEGLEDYFERVRPEGADLPRPLHGERDRGRRRRALRRRRGLDRRDHAARRGGRDPLRRLRLRAAAALAGRRGARRDPRAHARHRARARRRRADERPVRALRGRRLRDRGQPARVADGPVRLQGDRRPAGQDGLPGDARREASPSSGCRPIRRRDHVCVKEAVLPFDRFHGSDGLLGPEMRSTGEVMGVARTSRRRSPRRRPPPASRCPTRAPCSSPSPTSTRPRPSASRRCCTTSASTSSPPAARPARSPAWASRSERLNKVGEGSPNVVDWIEERQGRPRRQHAHGLGARTDG